MAAVLNSELLKAMIKSEGVAVRYWPIWDPACQDEYIDTVTTSEPWTTGSGTWIVKLRGKSGGQAVAHCAFAGAAETGPAFDRGRPGRNVVPMVVDKKSAPMRVGGESSLPLPLPYTDLDGRRIPDPRRSQA